MRACRGDQGEVAKILFLQILNFSFVGIVGAGRGAARIVLWDLLRGGGGRIIFCLSYESRCLALSGWPFGVWGWACAVSKVESWARGASLTYRG